MIRTGNSQRLRQLPWAGAERLAPRRAASRFHLSNASRRFERANQDDAVLRAAFHQHIEQPVHSVVEIDIRRSCRMPFDKRARAGSRKSMARFIVDHAIRFGLDDDAGTIVPDELASNQRPCAFERVHLEKFASQFASIRTLHKPVG